MGTLPSNALADLWARFASLREDDGLPAHRPRHRRPGGHRDRLRAASSSSPTTDGLVPSGSNPRGCLQFGHGVLYVARPCARRPRRPTRLSLAAALLSLVLLAGGGGRDRLARRGGPQPRCVTAADLPRRPPPRTEAPADGRRASPHPRCRRCPPPPRRRPPGRAGHRRRPPHRRPPSPPPPRRAGRAGAAQAARRRRPQVRPRRVRGLRHLGRRVRLDETYTKGNPKLGAGRSVRRMAAQGVQTIYIQAARADWTGRRRHRGAGPPRPVADQRPKARRLRVVPWYLPDLRGQRRRPPPPRGQRQPARRHHRRRRHRVQGRPTTTSGAAAWSTSRSASGPPCPSTPLSAITLPNVVTDVINTSYWPRFPWAAIAPLYDVWQPMGYWTNRKPRRAATATPSATRGRTSQLLRAAIGQPDALGEPGGRHRRPDHRGRHRRVRAGRAVDRLARRQPLRLVDPAPRQLRRDAHPPPLTTRR